MGSLIWEVVGGGSTGGIQVRTGPSLQSELSESRLTTGALVLQRSLVGLRLCYSLVAGGGPTEGWVSISVPDKDLLVRVEPINQHPKAKSLLVACVGDSITGGGGSLGQQLSYPALLNELLREQDAPPDDYASWAVETYAAGTTTATREAPHTPYMKTRTFREAMKSRADIFVICLGSSDAHKERWTEEGYVRGMKRLVEVFRALGPRLVCVMTPPPVYLKSGHAATRVLPVINEELPKRILPALAEECGVPLVNTFDALGGSAMNKPGLMLGDGIHPDVLGNEIIANLVCGVVMKHLGLVMKMAVPMVPEPVEQASQPEASAQEQQEEPAEAVPEPASEPAGPNPVLLLQQKDFERRVRKQLERLEESTIGQLKREFRLWGLSEAGMDREDMVTRLAEVVTWGEMSLQELQRLCRERELDSAGEQKELVRRLAGSSSESGSKERRSADERKEQEAEDQDDWFARKAEENRRKGKAGSRSQEGVPGGSRRTTGNKAGPGSSSQQAKPPPPAPKPVPLDKYFAVLGLASTTDQSEVRKAYRRLAIQYHPDKNPEEAKEESEAKFREVLEAYEKVSHYLAVTSK